MWLGLAAFFGAFAWARWHMHRLARAERIARERAAADAALIALIDPSEEHDWAAWEYEMERTS